MADTHKHECPKCGCVWQHGRRAAVFLPPEAHKCPRCGAIQGAFYRGGKPAEFVNHHLKKREAGRA